MQSAVSGEMPPISLTPASSNPDLLLPPEIALATGVIRRFGCPTTVNATSAIV
jgi:hypothetical protein